MLKKNARWLVAFSAPLLVAIADDGAWAAGVADPVVPVLSGFAALLFAASLGSILAARTRQPDVLGELIVGVLLGNLAILGLDQLEFIRTNETLAGLASLGVILLLFEVGLETSHRGGP